MATHSNNLFESRLGISGTRVQANATSTNSMVSLVSAPGSGLSLYITDIIFSTTTTGGDYLAMDDGTTEFFRQYTPIYVTTHLRLQKPFKVGDNKALRIKSSTTTTFVTVLGFTDNA